jgi:site-specific DNA-methyltransferase (adenine-specific)
MTPPIITPPADTILHGDCTAIMRGMPAASVDCIVTDPPYIVSYRSRDGRGVPNDDNAAWLQPAFAGMYRMLKPDAFCVSFYGWNKADLFIAAWRAAGFRMVGHLVFRKRYASSVRFLRHQHEQAYVLAKGAPELGLDPTVVSPGAIWDQLMGSRASMSSSKRP